MARRGRGPATIRGYLPISATTVEDLIGFVLRRRGPRRPVIEWGHRERMMAYAEGAGIDATYPEATVHYELTMRELYDQVHYDFQSSVFGGRLELGGAVVDFLFKDRPLCVRVQGEYWHTPFNAQGLGISDEEQKLMLEWKGWTVVDFWESEILDKERREAWFRQHIDAGTVHQGMPT